jgi:CRP-like cAMP-binding protein
MRQPSDAADDGLNAVLFFFARIEVMGTIANGSLTSKFERLGIGNEDVDAFVRLLRQRPRVPAGADIARSERSAAYSTLLLTGVACSYKRSESGTRQIYSFQYPGDFCDLCRCLLPECNETLAVQALSECSIATILHSDIKHLIMRRPRLRLGLWRAAMLEASVLRQWLSNARQGSAVQRVANLLCEQLVRREAIGIVSPVLPLTQVDVADAASLSSVHVNRTIQALRNANVLSKASHGIEVIDRKQLARIARFKGGYLERGAIDPEVTPSAQTRA